MTFVLLSFIAGVLTVLAPCILPVLPVIVGGSVAAHTRRNPYVMTAALAIAVVLFTLILKVSTIFIDTPEWFWSILSGTIIILFGLHTIFPSAWERVSARLMFSNRSNAILDRARAHTSISGDILLGLALGPVFSSCSPTYFVILATVLPQSLAAGIVDLIAYAVGLSLSLLAFSLLGQKIIARVAWAVNPHGWFKRGLGILFCFVGILIITGADKRVQTYLLDQGYGDITRLETLLLQTSLDN